MTVFPHETTVLLANDHPLISYALHQALDATQDFRVVAEAHDGAEALAQLHKYKPHIAVLDIAMPRLDGFRVAAAARAEKLPSKIVLLSGHNQARLLKKALRLDVQGYLLKDSALAEIIAGLRTVAKGKPYFSPTAMMQALQPRSSARQMLDSSAGLASDLAPLTPTEKTILKLVGECCMTKEIAAQLFVSPRTVEKHRANICQKLELKGNHALTKFALAQRE